MTDLIGGVVGIAADPCAVGVTGEDLDGDVGASCTHGGDAVVGDGVSVGDVANSFADPFAKGADLSGELTGREATGAVSGVTGKASRIAGNTGPLSAGCMLSADCE